MTTQYQVAHVSPEFLYGRIAPVILEELTRRYEAECNIVVKHWVVWVFGEACAVPVPTQIDDEAIPPARACRLFKLTLQEVSRVEMHRLDEADRFMISNAIDQLDELSPIGLA